MCFPYLTFDYSIFAHKLTVIKQMINVIYSYKKCFTESKPLTVPKSINVILIYYWKEKLKKIYIEKEEMLLHSGTYADSPQKSQVTDLT